MIVVADAGPPSIPSAHRRHRCVASALSTRARPAKCRPRTTTEQHTPAAVRAWIAQPRSWCEIRPDPPADLTLAFLGPGERSAIPLALAVHAERPLIDDLAGRGEARRRHLRVTGTVGVLASAHLAGLVDFEQALARLLQTNFYVSDEVIASIRQDIAHAEGNA